MQVSVTRKGRLAADRPGEEVVTLPEGATIGDLLASCGVDRRACVVVVNGVAAPVGTALRDGDRAQLYPAQAGG